MSKETYWRKFLNKSKGKAVVEVAGDAYIELSITDCRRAITLEFYVDRDNPEKSAKELKHKLSVLRTALDKVEAQIDKHLSKT